MVRTGKLNKRRVGWVPGIVLFSFGLVYMALPQMAASMTTTQSEGTTETRVAPNQVIVEREVINEEVTSGGDIAASGSESGTYNWIKRFNNGAGKSYATAMAVTSSAVYVTGRTWNANHTPPGWDYLTVKYRPADGYQWWAKTYNGPGNGFDEARAIAVDGLGNVYVTGFAAGDGTHSECVTIKYSSSGGEEWVSRYVNEMDSFATAMALDGQNNVYVTGATQGFGTGWDYLTIKYNSATGDLLWWRRYNWAADNRHDSPSALAVDAQGNVYVTGASWRSGKGYDYATVKYDPNGNEKWTKTYNSLNGHDYASAITVDALSNVYVTGSSTGSSTGYDYLTIAYKADGSYLWPSPVAKRYLGGGHDYARAIAVDRRNPANVYVTGMSLSATQSADFLTLKYTSTGALTAFTPFDGVGHGWDEPTAIAVDSRDLNNVYVYVAGSSTGTVGSGTDPVFAAVRYKSDGTNQTPWTHNVSTNGGEGATAMALDNQGIAYVTGFSADTDPWDCTTISFTLGP